MDRFDERILQALQADGRISNVELAERVGLSPSATLRRVQELERKKVIKGYRVIVDKSQLDIGFVAYVAIGLNSHTKRHNSVLKSTYALLKRWWSVITLLE